MPGDCASRLRGSPTVRPCTDVELAGILPAIAVATDPPPARRGREGPGKSRARQSLSQKHRIYAAPHAVIPAKAGIHFDSALWRFAKPDSHPCVVWSPSMATSHFLLLAQKKVTKENGTLGSAPSPSARVRYGRTGSADRPSMACSRIGAIHRADRALRGWSVRPSPLLRGMKSKKCRVEPRLPSP